MHSDSGIDTGIVRGLIGNITIAIKQIIDAL